MGEAERKRKAELHEQATALAATAASGSGQTLVITCILNLGEIPLPPGTGIMLIDRQRAFIHVYDNIREVGQVSLEDSRLLREVLAIQGRRGRSIAATVLGETDVQNFSAELRL